ncbi:MAG TPA: hypothetical protein PKW82_06490 [Spirochaetales bacterium]|nr:hypothetical protein [Spirochaetales bacterium]
MRQLPRPVVLALAVLACALATGALFFTLLAFWALVAGPFARLGSAAPVIVGAFALAAFLVARLWRALVRPRV